LPKKFNYQLGSPKTFNCHFRLPQSTTKGNWNFLIAQVSDWKFGEWNFRALPKKIGQQPNI
jgi:hypothetical protein